MKNLKSIFAIFAIAAMIASCEKEESTPTVDNTPQCEKNHTARVKFQNNSTNNKTYNIVWDGLVIETLYPFTESDYYTVAAGSHSLTFKISNNGTAACNPSNPVLVECQDRVFGCSY